jgi:hypothetical protein
MKKSILPLMLMAVTVCPALKPQEAPRYPPLREYMMPEKEEIALSKSAAPAQIADHATIKVLTESGYKDVQTGSNGFVCMVMRGFTGAPTFTPIQVRGLAYDPNTRAPICLNPQAVKMVLPYYELRTRLGMQGKTPEEIADEVKAAYRDGRIPKRTQVSFGYMWSADQVLGPAGHWHPHVMVYAPDYDNSMLGNNPSSSIYPVVGDDSGTPFAVLVIPVDESLAIKAKQ